MKTRKRVQTGGSLSGSLSSSCQYQQTHWLLGIKSIFGDRRAASGAGVGGGEGAVTGDIRSKCPVPPPAKGPVVK